MLKNIPSLFKGVRPQGKHGFIAYCPLHNNRNTQALSVTLSAEGKLLVFCHAGCNSSDLLNYIRSHGVDISGYRSSVAQAREENTEEEKKVLFAKSLWERSLPIEGTLAETYLRKHRQINCPLPSSLRFHPRLKHTLTEKYYPAMIAKVQDHQGNFLGIHRTYLESNGSKANIPNNKMMLGNCVGGFVPLSNPQNSEVLAVGEGIETCLSVAEMYPSFIVVSALSSSGIKRILLPDFAPKSLVIVRDGDKAGYEASNVLAERAFGAGWKVQFLNAPKGEDFNDVLTSKKMETSDE
jgi:hypothetical protein